MGIRAAVLISGEPRFCAEFDQLVNNLKGCDQIDWFFYLWKTSQNYPHQTAIADSWLDIKSKEWASDVIQANLPVGHNVAGVELVDQTQFIYPDKPHPHYVNPRHIWIMYQGIYGAYKMLENQGPYDLIIRARPDVDLDREVNLQEVRDRLNEKPNSIFSNSEHVHGYGYKINDWVGVGLPDTMKVYTDLVNRMEQYTNEGVTVHGETMLAYHLHKNNIQVQTDLFNFNLRVLGTRKDNIYYSNFGRWA
jgi:hypothetical protein